MLGQVDAGVQDPYAYEEFRWDGYLITRLMRDEMRLIASL